MPSEDSRVLLEQPSPHGNGVAHVEEEGGGIFFYLYFPDLENTAERVKACWVRNLVPAPAKLEVERMREGSPPLLPRRYCRHPEGAALPAADDLEVVWFEEGNGAALLERGEPLAVIPPWSGQGDFRGYARDCTAESRLCWPMPTERHLFERINNSRSYWAEWERDGLWPDFSDEMIDALTSELGQEHSRYFAIDGGQWPPKAMLLYEFPDHVSLITVGVSLRAQPNCEMYVDDPAPIRRIELAAAFDRACPTEQILEFGRYLSGQAGYPWSHFQWLGDGHTLPCDSVPPALGGKTFDAVVFSARPPGGPRLNFPRFRGDPVNLLWMMPITPTERDFAMAHSSRELVERLGRTGAGYIHRSRAAVA